MDGVGRIRTNDNVDNLISLCCEIQYQDNGETKHTSDRNKDIDALFLSNIFNPFRCFWLFKSYDQMHWSHRALAQQNSYPSSLDIPHGIGKHLDDGQGFI